MKKIYSVAAAIIFVLPLLLSCHRVYRYEPVLGEIEKILASDPDSAYNRLVGMKSSVIFPNEEKARYALLYSLASELSGKEELNDSLVSYVTDYYLRKPNRSGERSAAYFLSGRIKEMRGDENGAMFCYVAADRSLPFGDNDLFAGRLHAAKARLYEYSFDYHSAVGNYIRAGEELLHACDTEGYVHTCLQSASCHIKAGDKEAAGKCLETLKSYWNRLRGPDKVRSLKLLSQIKDDVPIESIQNTIRNEFSSKTELEAANLLSISDLYLMSGHTTSALRYLNAYAEANPDYRHSPYYYLQLSNAYDSMRLYRQAYAAYKKHVYLKDSVFTDRIQENVSFVEEKYDKQVRLYRAILTRTVLFVVLAVIVVAAALLIFKYRKKFWTQKRKSSHLESLYNSVLSERDALNEVVNNSVAIDDETRRVLEDRVFVLDKIIVERLFEKGNYSPDRASEMIETIVLDREVYLNTLGLLFSLRHPRFSSYLRKCQLETWEIGYCSLYCMGYKGKEIGNIISTSRYYKINSSIRRKLGMGPKDTNVDIYLRKLMAEKETKEAAS